MKKLAEAEHESAFPDNPFYPPRNQALRGRLPSRSPKVGSRIAVTPSSAGQPHRAHTPPPALAAMNEIENRRYKETLDKEKKLRREWNAHDAMAQVFDNGTEEMNHLNHLRDHLEKACADQTRTTTGETEQPSRRKQLVHSTAAQAPRAIACVEGRSDAPRVARVLHRSRCGMSCGRA